MYSYLSYYIKNCFYFISRLSEYGMQPWFIDVLADGDMGYDGGSTDDAKGEPIVRDRFEGVAFEHPLQQLLCLAKRPTYCNPTSHTLQLDED